MKNLIAILNLLFSFNLMAMPSVNEVNLVEDKIKKSVTFIENKGQIHDQHENAREDILFGGNDGSMFYFIKADGISYQMAKSNSASPANSRFDHGIDKDDISQNQEAEIYRVDMNWIGAASPTVELGQATGSIYHYYNTPNAEEPLESLKLYNDFWLRDVWQGVDVHFHNKNGVLESDWHLDKAADLEKIKWQIQGAEIKEEQGVLVMTTPFGEIREGALQVVQNGIALDASWIIENEIVTIEVKSADLNSSMVIDPPTIAWYTYAGGNGNESLNSISSDAVGNIYVGGSTNSLSQIATIGAHQTTYAGGINDGLLMKFNSNGQLIWGTYFGGSDVDGIANIEVSASGELVATGSTKSSNGISTNNSHQAIYNGSGDAFLAKFTANGIRIWSTYIGGNGGDEGRCILLSPQNNEIVLIGETSSFNSISTSGTYQPSKSGLDDAFIMKFDSQGNRIWGTYFGGPHTEFGEEAKMDALGYIYVMGSSFSQSGIATNNASQAQNAGGFDAYAAKFNSSGKRIWSTYIGGPQDDLAWALDLDDQGHFYIAGVTESNSGIWTGSVHQSFLSGAEDGFVMKYDTSGSKIWGSYYGGDNYDLIGSCIVDLNGDIWLGGLTESSNRIATTDGFQYTYAGNEDGFITRMTPTGQRAWSSYFGGNSIDELVRMRLVNESDPILAGNTYTQGLATPGVHQSVISGPGQEAFIATLYANPCTQDSAHTTITSCGSYLLNNGNQVNNSGVYVDSLVNTSGCDSLSYLDLTILRTDSVVEQFSICGSFVWIDGIEYFSSNNSAFVTLQNIEQCDSVVYLDLDILNNSFSFNQDSIFQCSSDSAIISIDSSWSNVTWSTGANGYSISVSQSGFYSAQVMDSNLCTGTDSVFVCLNDYQPCTGQAPINLDLPIIGAFQAVIEFDPVDLQSSQWIVEYGLPGFFPGNGQQIALSASRDTIGFFSSDTEYELLVYEILPNGSNSCYSDRIAFKTKCFSTATPLLEDFTQWPPQCWELDKGAIAVGQSQNDYAEFGSGNNSVASSIPVFLFSAVEVAFSWSHFDAIPSSGDSLIVTVRKILSADSDTLRILTGNSFNSSGAAFNSPSAKADFIRESIQITNPSLVFEEVVFEIFYISNGNSSAFIDYFEINDLQICLPPSNLSITAVDDSTIYLSWDAGSFNNFEWLIEYGPTGFNLGTGTQRSVYNPFDTIKGLSNCSDYDFHIREICMMMMDTSSALSETSFRTGGSATLVIDSISPLNVNNGIYRAHFDTIAGDELRLQYKGIKEAIWRSRPIWRGDLGSQRFNLTPSFGTDVEVRIAVRTGNNWEYGCPVLVSVPCRNQILDIVVQDAAFCAEDSVLLRAGYAGGQGAPTFLWSNGASTKRIFIQQGDTGIVTVTDMAGCTVSDTIIAPILDATAAPSNFAISKLNATTFRGTWSPSQIDPGMNLIAYRMAYRLRGTTAWTVTPFINDTTGTIDFTGTGLAAGNYEFTAFARYNNGVQNTSSAFACSEVKGYNGSGNKNATEFGSDNLSSLIDIYPNPASEVVYVNAPSGSQVQLVDMQGKILGEAEVTEAEINFDISNLAQGVYMIRITSNDQSVTEQVVKN